MEVESITTRREDETLRRAIEWHTSTMVGRSIGEY
jgi:hypothetical protein